MADNAKLMLSQTGNNSEMLAMNNDSVNMSMSEIDQYRARLSDEMALHLLPAIIVLSIVLLIGGLGNSLVFYVYFFKFNPSSTRSAILGLACLDLITCVVCIPGEILDLRYSYNFTSEVLCKGLRTVTTIVLMSSGFTLVTVAIDRYKRICHPLHQQLTAIKARNRVLVCCFLAMILAIPASIVYGLALVPTPTEGVYGMECSTSQSFASHPLRIAQNAILLVVFVVAFTLMIVTYILIGRQVLRQTHFRSTVQQRKASNASAGAIRRHTICSENNEERDHSISDGIKEHSLSHEAPPEPDLPSNGSGVLKPQENNGNGTKLPRKPSVLRRLRRVSRSRDSRTRKTTLMLFFITLVFVFSFLPHLLLKAIQAGHKNFVDNLNMAGVVLYNIFVRSYFFNTVANSFVYGFCSPKFRHECKSLLLKVAFWVKKRKLSVLHHDAR